MAKEKKSFGKPKKRGLGLLKQDISGWLFLLPAVICIYLIVVRPQINGIYWSFFEMNGYEVGDFVGLENYKRVMGNTMFMTALKNTALYVFYSLAIGFLIPVIMAVMMNELMRMRSTVRFFLFLPSVLPLASVMLIWTFVYYPNAGGLLNMILSNFGIDPYVWLQDERWTIMYIVIAMTWNGAGSASMYYFAALQGINRELYEAAIIDGAGFIKRVLTVTIPHIAAILALFFVRQIIDVFSVMEQPMQMTGGGPNGASTTLGLEAYKYGFVTVKPNYAMAIGVIMFLILMVATCFYFFINKKVEENM